MSHNPSLAWLRLRWLSLTLSPPSECQDRILVDAYPRFTIRRPLGQVRTVPGVPIGALCLLSTDFTPHTRHLRSHCDTDDLHRLRWVKSQSSPTLLPLIVAIAAPYFFYTLLPRLSIRSSSGQRSLCVSLSWVAALPSPAASTPRLANTTTSSSSSPFVQLPHLPSVQSGFRSIR
jgi:hypothetical protein